MDFDFCHYCSFLLHCSPITSTPFSAQKKVFFLFFLPKKKENLVKLIENLGQVRNVLYITQVAQKLCVKIRENIFQLSRGFPVLFPVAVLVRAGELSRGKKLSQDEKKIYSCKKRKSSRACANVALAFSPTHTTCGEEVVLRMEFSFSMKISFVNIQREEKNTQHWRAAERRERKVNLQVIKNQLNSAREWIFVSFLFSRLEDISVKFVRSLNLISEEKWILKWTKFRSFFCFLTHSIVVGTIREFRWASRIWYDYHTMIKTTRDFQWSFYAPQKKNEFGSVLFGKMKTALVVVVVRSPGHSAHVINFSELSSFWFLSHVNIFSLRLSALFFYYTFLLNTLEKTPKEKKFRGWNCRKRSERNRKFLRRRRRRWGRKLTEKLQKGWEL